MRAETPRWQPRLAEELEDRSLLSILAYSTYWGGSRNEVAADVAADSEGNTYVIGTTESADLAGDSGPDTFSPRAYLTKFTAEGQVEYSTLLGPAPKWDEDGYADSQGMQIVIGPDDLPLVSFATYETAEVVSGIPTGGSHNLHVAKLDFDGAPIFDTIAPVLDSPDYEDPYDFGFVTLATGRSGSVYVSYAALRETTSGGVVVDPFISRISVNGVIGFTEPLFDVADGLAVDGEENIYLALSTARDDLPVTTGAFQAEKDPTNPIFADIWIAKLDPTATGLYAATYLGGSDHEFVSALAVHPNQPNVVYLVGTTRSDDFPLQDPLQEQPPPGPPDGVGTQEFFDAFITALDLTVSPSVPEMRLVASTYFGGDQGEHLTDLAFDRSGGLIVVGSTNSMPIPLANPIQPAWNDGPTFHEGPEPVIVHDLVVARFDAALTGLDFSTYFGGSGHDSGARLAVDPNGTIHVTATSAGAVIDLNINQVTTDDFPIFNAVQSTFGGGDPSFFAGGEHLLTDAVVLAIAQRGTLAGLPNHGVQGRAIDGAVAVFTSPRGDASPDDFSATINWGDGTSSPGTITQDSSHARWFVRGLHQYSDPGTYAVVVQVEDQGQPLLSPVTNIDVSHWEGNQTGGAIAIDPTDPDRLFMAMTDEAGATAGEFDGGLIVAPSGNRGAAWAPRKIANGEDELPVAHKNPDVLFDDFGNLFLAYQGADGNNIVIAWSTDGGYTFDGDNVRQLEAPGSSPGSGVSFVGSPKLAFGAANNEIWVTFEDHVGNQILAAGAAVGGLGEIGEFELNPVNGSENGAASDIAVGPAGDIAVVWQTTSTATARVLTNFDLDGLGPANFSIPTTLDTSSTNGRLTTPAQQSPVPLGATLAWNTSEGKHRGRLHAAYVDLADDVAVPPGPQELTLLTTFSDDLGVNWSTPRRITLDPTFQSMFQPSIAFDPVTDSVAVGWYGTRGSSGTTSATNFFVATSNDGFNFSEPQQVGAESSDALDANLSLYGQSIGYGEAPGLAFLNGLLYPVWSDNSSLAGENYFPSQFEVATAIVGTIEVNVPPVSIRPEPIAVVNGELFTKTVATFTHLDVTLRPADFVATIHWGDGDVSAGLVTQPGGPASEFIVSGTHAYTDAGAFPLWVEVQDNLNDIHASPVSNVSAQQGSQSEPSIAVDPTNPDRVFSTSMHTNLLTPVGISVAGSDDGGTTWNSGTIADGNDGLPVALAGAPRAVFDSFGNLFLTYLTAPPERHVVVLLSTDGGSTFTHLATFDDVDQPLQPSIAVGSGGSTAAGSVWLSWQQGQYPFNVIKLAGAPVFSLGGVGGFGQRLVAPFSPDGLNRNFSDIAVGRDGQVLVSYVRSIPGGTELGPAEIVVQLDPDGLGLQPFGSAIVAAPVLVGTKLPIPAQPARTINTQGSLAWDTSNGEHAGRVYLVYTDAPSVGSEDTNVFIMASDDNGQNWSEPVQVHDDDPGSQFLPSVAVDRDSGNVGVAWYTTVDSTHVGTQFTATLSDDGGSTFRLAYRVSPGESDATVESIDDFGKIAQYGRRTGLTFVGGVLQPIWTDNSNELAAMPDPRSFDTASARIAVAEVTRTPLIVTMFDIDEVEGSVFTTRVATFTDPDGALPAASYRATIDWGDGSQPSQGSIQQQADGSFAVHGTHEYTLLGHYPVSVTIKAHRTKGDGELAAVIANAPLDLSLAANLRVVREMQFTEVVATFTDQNPHSVAGDFIATIEWGDGGTSFGIIEIQPGSGQGGAPNTFRISGTHKYLAEQSFTLHVSLIERPSGAALAEQGQIVSGDPPLVVDPGQFLDIEALEGIDTGDLVLVTFVRADGIEVQLDTSLGEYTAAINWGDGQVDTNIRPFVTDDDVTVTGRHTYATVGEYFPLVTLVDDSGGFFSAPLVAKVEPDVTSLVSTVGSGLIYNPATERFVGELNVTNTSGFDISGPFFAVFHDLPAGVTLANHPDVTGAGDPVVKVERLKLQPGESLDPIELEFNNPSRVPINYSVQVFDGVRSSVTPASLVFEANLGQADEQVAFLARGTNYGVLLAQQQSVLSLKSASDDSPTIAAVFMQWLSGNPAPNVIGLEPQAGVSNYFIGSNAAGWITGVPHFGRVRYESVYEGIDLEYYGHEGQLEYDWVVAPGADPSQIVMQFAGAEAMVIDGAGNLRLTIGDGQLVERAPLLYQMIAGERRQIAGGYVLHDDRTVTFDIGAYDPAATLVIDPVLIYSTYFGGPSTNTLGNAIAVDDDGNTYLTGLVAGVNFPTSANAFQTVPIVIDNPFLSQAQAFVVKLGPQGVPIYSTYLSGNDHDEGRAIAVDDAGYAYVTGITESLDFPVHAAFQSQMLGFNDGFLAKLTPDGSRLVYSTYLGGAGPTVTVDLPLAIAVDDSGAAYVAGATNSPFLFPTQNALQGPSGDYDGFLTKFDPSGSSLEFSTYLGGSGLDEIRGISLDGMGHVVVVGNTDSRNLPTPGALFDEYHVDPREEEFLLRGLVFRSFDAFVAKLPTDGSALDVLTYLGGTGSDLAAALATDGAGNVYLAGRTDSPDLPLAGALQSSLNGLHDGFVFQLDSALSSILFGTYLGGGGSVPDGTPRADAISAIGVDEHGNIIVAGETDSADLPVTAALQSDLAGKSDWLLASINPTAREFNYLTYMGGIDDDHLTGLAIDPAGNVVMTGWTNAVLHLLDFPTYRAFQTATDVGDFGMIIAKVASEPPPGFNRLELIHHGISAVEGSGIDGLVASFITVGAEQASDFVASIDWGDGTVSAGTVALGPDPGILGRRQFNVLGSHVYADMDHYDVAVTVRDPAGNRASARNTSHVDGAEHVRYQVAIDTTALQGQSGLLSVQFNPGASAESADASLTLLHFAGNAVLGTNVLRDGESAGDFSGGATLGAASTLNRISQSLLFGDRIEFVVEIAGDAIAQPTAAAFGDMFAVQLLASDGVTPLLTTSRTGAALTIAVDPDGTTRSQAMLPDPTAARSAAFVSSLNTAAIANAPLDALVTPFSVQEGAEFSGIVATFTNSNSFETVAQQHGAMIDWGDGTAPSAGMVVANGDRFSVIATHTYHRAGDYPLHVNVIDPDGASTAAREPIVGSRIEASRAIGGTMFFPVIGDFDNDSNLDVVDQTFLSTVYKATVRFGNGDFTFASPSIVDIPIRFAATAAGDFNEDGVDDILAAGANNQTGVESLNIIFGSRDRNLRASAVTTPLPGFSVSSVVSVDVDSDGHLDVVVSYLGFVAACDVLHGRGDGTFEPAVRQAAGFAIQSIAAGDLNNDGHPDLVAGSRFSTSLQVLLGAEGGTFTVPTVVNLAASVLSLAVADMNGDGRSDVVVGTGNLVVLTGAGDGTFTAMTHRPANWVEKLAVGDLNRDGRPDVVASDLNSTVTLILATIDGGFKASQTMVGPQVPEVFLADFNNDTQLDVAAGLRIYPGRGDGTVEVAEIIPSGFGSVDAAAADVNNDGFVDLVTPASGRVAVTLGRGDGKFDSAPQLPLRDGIFIDRKPTSIALADLDGNGQTDIVAGVSTGVAILMRNLDGSYLPPLDTAITERVADVATADVNGDGFMDIVATIPRGDFALGSIAVLLNAGDGKFGSPQYLSASENPRSLLVRDLNGDGRADIAAHVTGAYDSATAAFPNTGIQVFHGQTGGTFSAPLLVPAGLTQLLNKSLTAGDLNGDGILDLVVAAAGFVRTDPARPFDPPVKVQDGVYILLGNADGSYRAGTRYLTDPGAALPNLASVTLGDFNRDGNLDIAATRLFFPSGADLSEGRTDDLSVLLGSGDGTFGPPITYDFGRSAGQLLSGDLNRDGIPDLIAAQPSVFGGDVYVRLGKGDGTFDPTAMYLSGVGGGIIAIGDLDRDGRLDVATGNKGSDGADSATIGLLLGRGDGTLRTARLSGHAGSSVAVGDANKDGMIDVAVGGGSLVSLSLGNGDGSFDPPNTKTIANGTTQLAFGDIDGDGQNELLVSGDFLVVLPIGADGSLGSPSVTTAFAFDARFVMGDFNADGRVDVARVGTLFGADYQFVMLLGQSDGTIVTLPTLPAGKNSADITAADFNGDGRLDVAIANAGVRSADFQSVSSGGVSVLLGKGDGTFQPPVDYHTDQPFKRITAADLDGDGRPDIIVSRGDIFMSATDRSLDVMYNRGDGTFDAAQRYHANQAVNVSALTKGDFAADGLADIVVAGGDATYLRVIHNVPLPVAARVLNAPLTAVALEFEAATGVPFSGLVGSFNDANPFSVASDFIASIDWGDGQTSAGTVTTNNSGGLDVTGVNTYSQVGSFAVRITIHDRDGASATAVGLARVVEPSLTASGVTFEATVAVAFTGVVASFIDPDPQASVSNYSATIDWGDGNSSVGAIAAGARFGFDVIGTHSYAIDGSYDVIVNIAKNIGISATAVSHAIVRAAEPVNRAPELSTIGNRNVGELEILSFTMTATDPDGTTQTLAFSLDSGAPVGATISTAGVFIWTPTEAQGPGTYLVTVRVRDNGSPALEDFESFSIVVNEVNAAPELTHIGNKSVAEGTTLSFIATATDVDLPANSPTFSLGNGALAGASITSAGVFTWTPTEAQGPGSYPVTVRVRDNVSPPLEDFETITIVVNEVNAPPELAHIGNKSIDEGTTLSFITTATDVDLPANSLTFSLISGAPTGVSITPAGVFAWTPTEAQGPRSYSVTVRVRDNGSPALEDFETFTIVVNEVNVPPVAAPDSVTTAEDTAISIAVLANDTDIDGGALAVSSVGSPSHGTTFINQNGTILYTPAANYHGPDGFTYTVSDGNGGTAIATVSLSITPINDPPTAVDDQATTNEDTLFVIPVRNNDIDVDGDPLTITSATQPAHGIAIINANGTITYTPLPNFHGTDTFIYILSDGHGGIDPGTVLVTISAVNDPPIANGASPDAATTAEDTPVTIDVLANDTDVDGDALSVLSVNQPVHGSVVINSNRTTTYSPAPNFSGSDSFAYVASDGHGGTATGTVNVIVTAVNDPPVANADSFTTQQNTPLSIPVSQLLTNDTDVDVNSLIVVSVAPTASTSGTVTLSGGTVTHTPAANFIGATSFSYTISDGQGGTAVGAVNVTVNGAGTPGKVTGGGSIDSGVRNFGFNVQGDETANGLSFKGNVEFKDKKNGIDLKSTSLVMLTINSDGIHATFSGIAKINGVPGYRFTVEVQDRGEPGAGVDRFRMLIPTLSYDSDVHATKGGVLDKGGNIQVHTINPTPTTRTTSTSSFSADTTSTLTTQSFADPFDVNRDGSLTALDVLQVINRLNAAHDRAVAELVLAEEIAHLDVNRDGDLTALDALMVVNELNRRANETALGIGLASQNLVEPSLENNSPKHRAKGNSELPNHVKSRWW